MHLVHRNLRYSDSSEAAQQRDGFAVIGIMFELDPYDGQGTWLDGVKPYHTLDNVCLDYNIV